MKSQQIAKIISFVFNPFIVTPLTLTLVAFVASHSIEKTLWWLCIILGTIIIPNFAFVAYNVRIGRYSDLDVSVREQRHGLFLIGAGSLIVCVILLNLTAAPPIMLAYMYAAIVGTAIGSLLNRLVAKVSGHAFANALCTTIMFIAWPVIALAMAATTVLVGWSRVKLKRHTLLEVVFGLGLGILSVLFVFYLYLGGTYEG